MKTILSLLLICSGTLALQAQSKWFPDTSLSQVGAYYYPEHWDESQWERDLGTMSALGFEFTHFGEFAWAEIEPEEGVFDFEWLDRAVDIAAKHNLKVIMCTPTATPPVWLVRKHPEILLQDESGRRLDHGARQHASFSSPTYRAYALKMVGKLAEHYASHPAVIGWQLDNEPDVQYDYSSESLSEFRKFLTDRYGNDIRELNRAWGTLFWSQTYRRFEEITFPQMRVPLMNPHQILDFRRYAAFQTHSFLASQCREIRKHTTRQWITTNYIPNYEEGNIGGCRALDFESYTRYMVHGEDPGKATLSYRLGDPLRICKPNDMFRSVSGSYGVMELQPGQVNWGDINPQPEPGAVRLWLWSVFAGGSDFICTYRFRQPLFGIEQYHNGIMEPDGTTLSRGGKEFKTFIDELKLLRTHYAPREEKPAAYRARKAAILFNHENAWNIARQKQTVNWDTNRHLDKYYATLKSMGAPVDFIREESDFSQYPILIAPAYQMVDEALIRKWEDYVRQGGCLLLTCRTGHKDKSGHLFETRYGGKIADLIGADIDFYDLPLPDHPGRVKKDEECYSWNSWGEILTPRAGTSTIASYASEFYSGKAAAVKRRIGKGWVVYAGVDSCDGEFERSILSDIYEQLNIPVLNLPPGIVIEYRNGFGIVMNYSTGAFVFPLPDHAEVLIGEPRIQSAGVLVFKTHEAD